MTKEKKAQMQHALAQKEKDHAMLADVRVELESVRAVLERVVKRESTKQGLVEAVREAHGLHMSSQATAKEALARAGQNKGALAQVREGDGEFTVFEHGRWAQWLHKKECR